VQDFKNLQEKYGCNYFFFTDEALPINFLKTFSEKLVEQKVDVQWTGELKFEKSLLRDNRMETLYKSGCRKLIFGLESYNQRVLDAMKKGCPTEVIDKTVEECIRIGISMHFYLLVGFPTETRDEVMDSVNFVMNNQAILDSPGFSCIASQFDLEKGTPLAKDPGQWGVYDLVNPPHHDLSLGFSYKIKEGLNAEQATEVYQEVVQRISREVMTFPHNYSLADGLLYLGHHEREDIQQRISALSV